MRRRNKGDKVSRDKQEKMGRGEAKINTGAKLLSDSTAGSLNLTRPLLTTFDNAQTSNKSNQMQPNAPIATLNKRKLGGRSQSKHGREAFVRFHGWEELDGASF